MYGFGSIVTLGVAVYNPYTREFLGVLFININIEAFEAAADGYEGGPEGNMFLTGKDSVVQGFAPSIYAPSFPKDKTIFDDMKEKQKDSVRKRIEERDVLFAYENIPGDRYVCCVSGKYGQTPGGDLSDEKCLYFCVFNCSME